MHTTARIFKALGDETRVRILGLLTRGERCVCDLMTVLEPAVHGVQPSRHPAQCRLGRGAPPRAVDVLSSGRGGEPPPA